MTVDCHQDVWILGLNTYTSNLPLFFALTHKEPSFNVMTSVIFWPGLQVSIKSPFLQNNYGSVNHHPSQSLLLPARL